MTVIVILLAILTLQISKRRVNWCRHYVLWTIFL